MDYVFHEEIASQPVSTCNNTNSTCRQDLLWAVEENFAWLYIQDQCLVCVCKFSLVLVLCVLICGQIAVGSVQTFVSRVTENWVGTIRYTEGECWYNFLAIFRFWPCPFRAIHMEICDPRFCHAGTTLLSILQAKTHISWPIAQELVTASYLA